MDAKAQIEAARQIRLANDVTRRGEGSCRRYLLIRKYVGALLQAEYIGSNEINRAISWHQYSEQRLLDLQSRVWGEK